jgi:RimJ/RimL family protein N-acetyltransferase
MRLRSGKVELRAFEPALGEALYAVRNHPSVRRHLRDARPIERASHERWVRENLLEARKLHLFVAFEAAAAAAPAGIALLRNIHGPEAEIGVMVIDAERRRRFAYVAAHLVAYYGFERLGLERLLSLVPRAHAQALEFNLSCGMEPTGRPSQTYEVLALTKARYLAHATHRRFRSRYRIEIED